MPRYAETERVIPRIRVICDGCGVDGPAKSSRFEALRTAVDYGYIIDQHSGKIFCHKCALKLGLVEENEDAT